MMKGLDSWGLTGRSCVSSDTVKCVVVRLFQFEGHCIAPRMGAGTVLAMQ
jgi:hypothetical protein